MNDIVIEYFKDPANRLKALRWMYDRLNLERSGYMCFLLRSYINIHLNITVAIDGTIFRADEPGWFKLHELIPELTHPIFFPLENIVPHTSIHIENSVSWGIFLLDYYINLGLLRTGFAEIVDARKLHIQNAIDKIQSYEV